MDTKKKLIYGVVAVAIAVFAWVAYGMFIGDGAAESAAPVSKANPDVPKPAALSAMQSAPKSASQPQAQGAPMSQREMQLMQIQQDTQAKYLAALNELQILKVEKDIAETNKDISKAKFDTVTAQKGVVDLLAPEKVVSTPESYAKGIDQSGAQAGPSAMNPPGATGSNISAPMMASSSYTVISVSRLRGQWSAVMGSQGKLYNVKPGDVLSADGSVVLSINSSGVLLEKDGKRQKVSMMPII